MNIRTETFLAVKNEARTYLTIGGLINCFIHFNVNNTFAAMTMKISWLDAQGMPGVGTHLLFLCLQGIRFATAIRTLLSE